MNPKNTAPAARPLPIQRKFILFEKRMHADGRIELLPVTSVRNLTVSEIASDLNVSIWAIYRAIDEKRLPAIRINGALRVAMEDYQKFLVAHNTLNEGVEMEPAHG